MGLIAALGRVFSGDESHAKSVALDGHVDKIGDLQPRTRVRVYGVVSAIVVPPVCSPARFDIEVDDGTGRINARWMGRENISGIDPGIKIELEGFATGQRRQLRLYNPRYTIHGAKDSEL